MLADQTRTDQLRCSANNFILTLVFSWARSIDYELQNNGTGQVIALQDGYTANLIIKDEYSELIQTFPTKSKEPPINIVDHFLTLHGLKEGPYQAIRVDQGGELWKSE